MEAPKIRIRLKAYDHRLLDQSAGEVIQLIRLNHARKQSANQEQTIANIAYACGFNDPGYFYRVFANLEEVFENRPASLF